MGPKQRKEKGPPNERWLEFLQEAAEIPTIDPSERVIKVVATMGPAWDSGDKIINMVKAGVGIVRLNCSHRTINGKTGEFERLVPLIRAAGLATGKKVEILGDLQVSSPYLLPLPLLYLLPQLMQCSIHRDRRSGFAIAQATLF